jgi:hypothetical protein
VCACPREHLLGGVDAPHLCAPLGECDREPPGTAADVEDPPPAQLTLRDENREQLPPLVVDGSEAVVVVRQRTEVGSGRLANGRR